MTGAVQALPATSSRTPALSRSSAPSSPNRTALMASGVYAIRRSRSTPSVVTEHDTDRSLPGAGRPRPPRRSRRAWTCSRPRRASTRPTCAVATIRVDVFPYKLVGARYDCGDTTQARSSSCSTWPDEELRDEQRRRREQDGALQLGARPEHVRGDHCWPAEGQFGAVENHAEGLEELLRTAVLDGQGHEPRFAMIVADRLGCRWKSVSARRAIPTRFRRARAHMRSKSTQLGGTAAAEAAGAVVVAGGSWRPTSSKPGRRTSN